MKSLQFQKLVIQHNIDAEEWKGRLRIAAKNAAAKKQTIERTIYTQTT